MTQPTKMFDFYAGHALAGILANKAYEGIARSEKVRLACKLACLYADLMLEERGQYHSVTGQDRGLEWEQ